ncbi:4Fe-4S binding protein [Methanobrevibacter sp. DSM 116169]|uniref:4Fe-4S binding protein n=1 Tax=Methanobrevibacter sp. DSM 116169 TaxID=3242727 RepID=UPI0038FD0F28
MASLMWYLYDFARRAWIEGFTDAKSKEDIVEKPSRFRDFPEVKKELCIACGACTAACPSPNAIKLIRDTDDQDKQGITFPVINKSACIRCGFCAEVCPTDPKTLLCGENHLILPEFNIVPTKKEFVVDDFLCIKCKKCIKECPVDAISVVDGNVFVDKHKCIYCGKCLDVCPVNGAMKCLYIDNLEGQKQIISLVVKTLEEYVESQGEQLRALPSDGIAVFEYPLNNLLNMALKIIPDEKIAQDIIFNAVNRLKIRIIDWDSDLCKKCQLCVNECPTGAISFDDEEDTIVRDSNKCLRCSICYQTCPFGVIKYFISKFSINNDENEEYIIQISSRLLE